MNASEGGLLIYFREQMEIGERLKLKLFRTLGSAVNTIRQPGSLGGPSLGRNLEVTPSNSD
jgi:hypothetical protein